MKHCAQSRKDTVKVIHLGNKSNLHSTTVNQESYLQYSLSSVQSRFGSNLYLENFGKSGSA